MTDVRASLHEVPNSAAEPDDVPVDVCKQMMHILFALLFYFYHQSLYTKEYYLMRERLLSSIPIHQGILLNA